MISHLRYWLLWLRVNYPVRIRQSRWNMLHSDLIIAQKEQSDE